MNLTVYLPDDIGRRAKDEGLPFSALLRAAVIEDLERRDALTRAAGEAREVVLDLEDSNGNGYEGSFVGRCIAEGRSDVAAYLTDDERVLLYDQANLRLHDLSAEPEQSIKELLREALDDQAFVTACAALGLKARIDI